MQEKKYHPIKSFVDDEIFLLPRCVSQDRLEACIFLSDRAELLRRLPKGGVVAEVGTRAGDFAKTILAISNPTEMHIFDLSFSQFDHRFFDAAMIAQKVFLHEGNSSNEMAGLPDGKFDWMYIDGDHSFEGVLKDIQQAKRLIRPDGFLVFDDYTLYSPLERVQYGVMRAVNDLCLYENFNMVMFALSPLGYHNVALRRRCSTGSQTA